MNVAQAFAAKVDRAATDPQRIEKRKRIAPTVIVPRHAPQTRVEWFGSLQVHQPIKPRKTQ